MNRKTGLIIATLIIITILMMTAVYADEITGTVTSTSKTPIQGAWIHFGSNISLVVGNTGEDCLKGKAQASVVADSKGAYTAWLPAGRYTMIVWKPGFVPVTQQVSIPGTQNVTMKPESNSNLHKNLMFEK